MCSLKRSVTDWLSSREAGGVFRRMPVWISRGVLSSITFICMGMTAAGSRMPAQEKPVPAQTIPVPAAVSVTPSAGGPMQLSYEAADLYTFINSVADALGITPVIIDPDVKGTVTIHSNAPMSRDDVFPLFNMILKNNNAALVKQRGVYQIVPSSSGLKQGVEMFEHLPPVPEPKAAGDKVSEKEVQTADPGPSAEPGTPAAARRLAAPSGDGARSAPRLATHVIHVEFVPVKDLIEPMKLFLTDGSVIMPYERTNMLVVTDYSDSIEKILQVIHALDSNFLDMDLIDLIEVTHNKASDVLEDLQKIFGGGKDSRTGVNLVSLDRMNSILVMANSKRALREVKTWIERLDAPGSRTAQTFVYTVQNSTASNIATILSALFGGNSAGASGGETRIAGSSGSRGGAAGSTGAAGSSSTGGSQIAGGITNTSFGQSSAGASSLATGQQLGPRLNQQAGISSRFLAGGNFVGLQGVVRMVVDDLNNSLIIQSSAADYQLLLETIKKMDVLPRQAIIDARIFEVDLTDSLSFGISANLQAASSDQQLTTGALDSSTGALSGSTFAFVGNSREILLALSALRTKTKVRVLEAPSVLALDGTMAKIVVGSVYPYSAGTVSSSSTTSTNVQYRDTGVSLIVVPQISASGSVTLDVAEEVSAPGSTSSLGTSFSKTSIATTLSVKDGQTVAIAGLIRSSDTIGRAGIPLLSGIPLLGHLWGTTSWDASRTELLILLTPHVICTPDRLQEITRELKDSLHNIRKLVGSQAKGNE